MKGNWLSQLQKFFDERARNLGMFDDEFALNGYKALNHPSYWIESVGKRLLDDIVTKLELSLEHHVLDVGCGTGMILRQIAPHVAHIIGADFSAYMLAIACRHPMSNVNLTRANAADLPFKEQAFDRVLCYFVIANFLEDEFAQRVLGELIRVTRKGGFVFIGNTPDYEKKDEQAKLVQEQSKHKGMFPLHRSIWNRGIIRLRNILSYRISRGSTQPSLGYRFYTRDFFKQFSKQTLCDVEFLPLNIEGFIYAPYRFDVRLWRT